MYIHMYIVNLTFTGPCIVNEVLSITNKTQSYTILFITVYYYIAKFDTKVTAFFLFICAFVTKNNEYPPIQHSTFGLPEVSTLCSLRGTNSIYL